jgi:hypothetical protein
METQLVPELKHPIQPLSKDEYGTIRFKENKMITYLLNNGRHDMNSLGMGSFSNEDQQQFAQLIGYSLSGYGELSYVSDDSYDTATTLYYEGGTEEQAELTMLRTKLETIKSNVRDMAINLFHIHPDDLT